MKSKTKLNILIIVGLIFGIIGGIIFPKFMNNIEFLGTIYINLLKFIIIPIIFTSVTVTVFKSKAQKTNLLTKSIILFVLMFVTTFLLTSVIFKIVNPVEDMVGNNLNFTEWAGEITTLNYSDIIVGLFPTNLSIMVQNNSIFACLLLSLLIGISASKVENGNKAIEVIESFRDIFYKILEYIMYLTPVAVFSLVGNTIAKYGTVIIDIGAKYIGMAYLCSILTLLLVMILPVWIYAKINLITYIRKIAKVWLMTVTTCSSAATLPYAIKTCNEEFGIPSKTTDIVVTLGCSIHMCGGAVSFALLGLFCSQLFGVEVTISSYIMMLISATLINMSAPGIPSGGIVLGATYLSMMNIPLAFIGLYSGIYRLLDMSYTTLNVTGNITADILINESIKK